MAERERPANWEDWKWLHRWPRLTSIEWALEWLVYWCRGWAIFEVLEFVGRASVLIAAITWIFEAGDRDKARMNEIKQKHYRAWELINSARGSTGDGGRRDALQDLNEDKVDLSAAPLAKAYLNEVQLPNANLSGADLSEANLFRAKLPGADLSEADLRGADLSEANLSETKLPLVNLSEAKLRWAKLSRAKLPGAKLPGADLRGANLSGANLPGAKLPGANLPGANLSEADLRGADLSEADLSQADLSEANLLVADLFEANLRGANLSGAAAPANIRNLHSAKFCQTTMRDGTLNNRDCLPEPTPPDQSETPPAPN